eukprot:Lithocolla_globosa_v1_NODE_935_length_3062_cov_11.623545.p1 type:complete len:968 gc:universal NODE_935_length_3062_cov_11.623545:2915-12(-)
MGDGVNVYDVEACLSEFQLKGSTLFNSLRRADEADIQAQFANVLTQLKHIYDVIGDKFNIKEVQVAAVNVRDAIHSFFQKGRKDDFGVHKNLLLLNAAVRYYVDAYLSPSEDLLSSTAGSVESFLSDDSNEERGMYNFVLDLPALIEQQRKQVPDGVQVRGSATINNRRSRMVDGILSSSAPLGGDVLDEPSDRDPLPAGVENLISKFNEGKKSGVLRTKSFVVKNAPRSRVATIYQNRTDSVVVDDGDGGVDEAHRQSLTAEQVKVLQDAIRAGDVERLEQLEPSQEDTISADDVIKKDNGQNFGLVEFSEEINDGKDNESILSREKTRTSSIHSSLSLEPSEGTPDEDDDGHESPSGTEDHFVGGFLTLAVTPPKSEDESIFSWIQPINSLKPSKSTKRTAPIIKMMSKKRMPKALNDRVAFRSSSSNEFDPASVSSSVNASPSQSSLTKDESFGMGGVEISEGDDVVLVMSHPTGEPPTGPPIIKAGTLDLLIEKLANEDVQDPDFVKTFQLVYRCFVSPAELLRRLITRFHLEIDADSPDEEASRLYLDRCGAFIQYRSLNFIKKWVERCWFDFHDEDEMLLLLDEFIVCVKESDLGDRLATQLEACITLAKRDYAEITHAFDPSEIKVKSDLGRKSTATDDPGLRKHPDGSILDDAPAPQTSFRSEGIHMTLGIFASVASYFEELNVMQVARQLTIIDFEFYRRIFRHEIIIFLFGDCRAKGGGQTPIPFRLSAYAKRFNEVSFWVGTEICTCPNLKRRINILGRFIRLAKILCEFNNFNGLMAVLSGIKSASVMRLKKTWAGLTVRQHATVDQLEGLMSSRDNYHNYRQTLLKDYPNFIPFIGLFLKDLTFICEGSQTWISHPASSKMLINFQKFWLLSATLEKVLHFQRRPYVLPFDELTHHYCCHLKHMDEDDIYEYSKLCEPRTQTVVEPKEPSKSHIVDFWRKEDTERSGFLDKWFR